MSTTNITPTELIIQYPCLWDNCRDSFLSLPELGAHIATAHLNTLLSFNCKWRTCHNYNFQTKYSLVQHIYSHLSSIPNHLQTREMVHIIPYNSHYVPSGIYPQAVIQSPYRPFTYQYTPVVQNFQSRSTAHATILALGNDEFISNNNSIGISKTSPVISPGQNSLLSVDPQSLVLRQYKIPQQIDLVTPSQIVIQEKVVPSQTNNIQDDSPIQCFSHLNASSTSTQRQDQISTTDLKKEIEELRDLLKEQTQKLNDKTQELDKNTEEMKKMADEINEKSREITKLKSTISLKDSEISIIKENLELQTGISKILQEQNRKADDKLRRMWVEMLCRKADLGEGVLNKRMNINDEPSFTSRKRLRRDKDEETENSDLHPMEIPAPPHENISVITKGITCSWDGCEKTFRTKLALKAHIVSSHMNEEILKVPVINP